MAKFCGKCGSKLDEATGLCSKCDAEKLAKLSVESEKQEEKQDASVKPEKPLSKKEIKKQKKADKKAAKKAKRAGWSIGKKIRRFLLKFILIILLIGAIVAGVLGTLVYFDYVDIPLISDLFDFIGVELPTDDETEEFNILSEKFTDIKITDINSAIQATQEGARILGIEDAAKELSVNSVDEIGNLTYYRLQQNYSGYPVYGRTFVLVSNGDTASNLTSNCFSISDVEINVDITQNDVRDSIYSYLKKIVGTDSFDYFDMDTLSDDMLCIYTFEDRTARLTYRVIVNTEYGSFEFFVDTITSEVLFYNEDVVYMQKEFTFPGQTDTHTFTAESSQEYNEMYYLSDSGTKVTVYIPSNGHDYDWYYDGNANIVKWEDGDSPDKSAVDAIYNISHAYSYYKDTFGRDSFSNQKEDINVYVHTIGYRNWSGQDVNHINNAYFWTSPNGPIISITQKYNSNNEIITDYGSEIDVIGHEFTHGVVGYTCALSNTSDNKMPSAINEAIADIMGYCIEADLLSQSIDWTCSVRTSIKSNNNNSAYVYHFDDYAGHEEEHSASTIVSYAAYLMNTASEGSLSDQEVAKLWYHTILTLPSNCTFKVLREHVEMAAHNLNFTDSQINTISTAFEAVGITQNVNESTNYSTNIDINVYGADSKPYDDYIIDISGTYNTGWFGWSWFGIFKKDFTDTIKVENSTPQAIYLNPNGEYTITVSDGKDNSKSHSKRIRVKAKYENSQMIFTTNFGSITESTNDKSEQTISVPADAVEFNGHYYFLYEKTNVTSYDEALEYCVDNGGYLATITSQEENDFVYSYITGLGCETAYLGLSDASSEGNWQWCTGESLSYVNWHSGEPNGESSNEDYAMFYYKYSDGTWNDGDFGGSTVNGGNSFICEWGDYTLGSGDNKAGESDRTTSDERDIVLALDVSGSMSGTPIDETRKASINFIETILEEDASIGIVTYDNSANRVSDFSVNKNSLENIVSGIYDGGGTNIEAGLREAHSMLSSSNAKKKIIVLMSDGEPNDGKEGDALVAYADEIKEDGVLIYTLGFFEDLGGYKSSAQQLMERIASDGCHYEVANADDLVFFFGDIADQLNGQKYIYVRIACPVDVSVTYQGQTLNSAESDLSLRTDFGTLTFEENEEAIQNGTDDRIKVLRLKEGVDYDLRLTGTGHGLMDYTIGFMDDEGNYSDLRKFEDIKITKRTVIDTVAATSKTSTLNIDENGDGKYDLRLRAGENGYGEEIKQDYLVYIIVSGCAVLLLIVGIITAHKVRTKKKGKVK